MVPVGAAIATSSSSGYPGNLEEADQESPSGIIFFRGIVGPAMIDTEQIRGRRNVRELSLCSLASI